ncbi:MULTISPECIES: hypothetical protein [unclassified Methylobacterium]|jgi:hypothetical protein|uniref:hypothetical protein n=1 Tax=unclassified Methylobacterium TaxID=2615210 RepID=UPI0013540283|nr:hypothetical protein [Methylobacterium sp. 2A]MWV22153.1 hypothetical protein [Methylobacterium sp. 2A]
MQQPPEFKKFSLQFYSGILDDVETEEELIDTVLSPFQDEQQRSRLRSYLNTIIQDDIDDKELQSIWWSSSADTVFRDSFGLRQLLKMARDRL